MPCVLDVKRYGLLGYIYFDEDHQNPHIHIKLNNEDLFVFYLEPPFERKESAGPKYSTQEKYMRKVLKTYSNRLLQCWDDAQNGKTPKQIVVPPTFK